VKRRSRFRGAPPRAHGGSAETARGLEREPRQYWPGGVGSIALVARKTLGGSARVSRKAIGVHKAIVPSLAQVMKVYDSHATKKES
jgi:hypothetical protein